MWLSILFLVFIAQKHNRTYNQNSLEKIKPLDNSHNNNDNNEKMMLYIYKLFPAIYNPNIPISHRLKKQLMKYHLFLSIFTDDNTERRIINAFELVTYFSFEFFITAFFYELQYPLENCQSHYNLDTCINRKTLLDSSQSIYKWEKSCIKNDIEVNFYIILLITIIVMIVAAPILL